MTNDQIIRFSIRVIQVIISILIFYFIISLTPLQAQAAKENDRVVYHLNQSTLVKGYPACSADGFFSIVLGPGVLEKETEVKIEKLDISKLVIKDGSDFISAYQFQLKQNGEVPLLKKPLTVILKTDDKSLKDKKYKRLYYYHRQLIKSESRREKGVWLALTSQNNKKDGILIGHKIDFAEGIIGFFVGKEPIQDVLSVEKETNSGEQDKAEPLNFTTILGSDIMQKGEKIKLGYVELTVPPQLFDATSTVMVQWDKSAKILKYDIKSEQPGIFSTRGSLLICVRMDENYFGAVNQHIDKQIEFWDNNLQGWQALPSKYDYQNKLVQAWSPFYFGRYRVIDKEGIYFGLASWFRDTLASKQSQIVLGAASNDYPKGTDVKVTNLKNNKSVVVKVISSGPFVKGRIIDLTRSAFGKIARPGEGVVKVSVEEILAQMNSP